MASISVEANGGRRIQFVDGNGDRKGIRLGKVSARDAQAVKIKIEALLSAKMSGASGLDREVAAWLAKLDSKMLSKLGKVGLLPEEVASKVAKVEKKPMTLQELVDKFIEEVGGEGRRKPGTVAQWRQVTGILLRLMPEGIAIKDITRGHATQYFEKLKKSDRATLTIAKNVRIVKQMFLWAVDWEYLPYSPFDRLKVPSSIPRHNVEVSREVITKVMAVCDDAWKAILALSRYAGMRCPSEVLSLRWEHVDFEANRLHIPEPKVEHHEHRGVRECPLFPEVREVLEPMKRLEGYVVNKPAYRAAANTGTGWKNANLRTQLLKKLAKAEVAPWPRLFHSMRATRQTELEREFPLHVVCSWLGNSEKVARASYLLVTSEDWAKAVQKVVQQESATVGKE